MKRTVKFKVGKIEYEMVNNLNYLPCIQLTEEQKDNIFIDFMKKEIKKENRKKAQKKYYEKKKKRKMLKEQIANFEKMKKYKGLVPEFREKYILPNIDKIIEKLKNEEKELNNQ